jgi:hypothetical protein
VDPVRIQVFEFQTQDGRLTQYIVPRFSQAVPHLLFGFGEQLPIGTDLLELQFFYVELF